MLCLCDCIPFMLLHARIRRFSSPYPETYGCLPSRMIGLTPPPPLVHHTLDCCCFSAVSRSLPPPSPLSPLLPLSLVPPPLPAHVPMLQGSIKKGMRVGPLLVLGECCATSPAVPRCSLCCGSFSSGGERCNVYCRACSGTGSRWQTPKKAEESGSLCP